MGVNPYTPPQSFAIPRDPTANDSKGYILCAIWLNTSVNPERVWILVSLVGNVATWLLLTGGTGTVISLTSNSGGPVFPLLGNINVVGDGTTITGVGNPATNTITFSVIGSAGAVTTLTGNSGGAVGPTAGNINVVGTGVITVAGNPGTSTLTITPSGSVASSFITNPATGTATPLAGVLTFAGAGNITASAAGSTVTFTGTGSVPWSIITADQTAAVNNGYICNKVGTLSLLLPATSAVGSTVRVTGMNTALGWKIIQAAGQQILFGTSSTTLGSGGSLASSATNDSIEIVCNVANTTWIVLSSIGNITVV